uniref:Glycosyltransferase n=1 Tax=Pilosella officinarum TaxID=221204 RepID=B2CZL4_PILOF|nr:glycosyltransferase UGT88A9 [Pilosella officinarum]
MRTIILYPSPGMGHLISMVELGKLILKHHPSFSIIVLTLIPSFNTGTTASYIRRISSTFPTITFHHLPDIPLDPLLYPSMEAIIFDLIRRSTPNVKTALHSISLSSPHLSAFIIDFFCTSGISVATTFHIPVYYFFTSGASCLAQFLHLPTLHGKTTTSFKDMNTLIHSPGLPPIPSSDLPNTILDRTSIEYSDVLDSAVHMTKSAGIIVNTFDSLEPKAIKAIGDGSCVSDMPTPPVYCIGPLVAAGGDVSHDQCLNWLDSQPSRSVVYLCFGSLGLFSSDQLREIGIGLEMSGHRFLWVVRCPPSDNKSDRFQPPPEPDLNDLLPEGFLDRTVDRGLVVKSWAPQVAVLNHESVGGFVTHCGWNSVLEAVSAGVPMVAWPLYAEQKVNKVVLVEEMKLALQMEESDGGKVTATEVEKRVRELMESSEEGKGVRQMVKMRKEEAATALSDGGSSRLALAKLVEFW